MDPRTIKLGSVSTDRAAAIAVIADGLLDADGALILPRVTDAHSAREWLATAGLSDNPARVAALLSALDLVRLVRALTRQDLPTACKLFRMEPQIEPAVTIEARSNYPG